MTKTEWKTCMGDLIDGVERELRPTVPRKTRVLLDALQKRLTDGCINSSRKPFEQDLEALLQSTSSLQAAARRHIRKTASPLIRAAAASLARARAVLAGTPNFSVERMAAGKTHSAKRALSARRHRSPYLYRR